MPTIVARSDCAKMGIATVSAIIANRAKILFGVMKLLHKAAQLRATAVRIHLRSARLSSRDALPVIFEPV